MSLDDDIDDTERRLADERRKNNEELQLSELNNCYASQNWAITSNPSEAHHGGFCAGWVAAMRWMKLRVPPAAAEGSPK